jgi:hypothetical protein
LLIKQEPEIETPQNPYNFTAEVDESFEESEDESDYESEEKHKVKKERKKYYKCKRKKDGIPGALETIQCEHCDKPIKKYYFKKHMER